MPKLDLKFWGVTRNRKSPEVFFQQPVPCQAPTPNDCLSGLGKHLPNSVSAAGRVIMKPCCSPSRARPGVHISSDPCSPYLLPYPPTCLLIKGPTSERPRGLTTFSQSLTVLLTAPTEARLPTLLEQQHTFLLRLEGAGRWLHPWHPR